MRLLVVGLGLIALLGCERKAATADPAVVAAQPPANASTSVFALSSKGPSATVMSLTGFDSAEAAMVGEVRRGDADEYCQRDPGGVTVARGGTQTTEQCIAAVLAEENGKTYSASADCTRKTIATAEGRFLVADAPGPSPGPSQPVWRNTADGSTLDGSEASGAGVLTQQFGILCPGAARALAG